MFKTTKNCTIESEGACGQHKEECSSNGGNGIDCLLEKKRREIMYELRRLKLGERPVTGQGNKEAVETLLHQQTLPGGVEHRPDAVIVEVQGLVERRPVSNILQSARFRRQLENAIRSSISNVATEQLRHSNISRVRSEASRIQTPVSAQIPQEVSSNVSESDESISMVSATSSPETVAQIHIDNSNTPSAPLSSTNLPTPALPLPRIQRAAAWLENHIGPNIGNVGTDDHRQQVIADRLNDAIHEGIIEEISELVQRQLVTNTLSDETQFRGRLESLISDHVSASGHDGIRVQQVIQNLPNSNFRIRNDFSALGIHSGAALAASSFSDEISVISGTAAVHVQETHISRSVALEMAALRAQVTELKNMMTLSFDMQLDIQRSIRQEVAAALSCSNSANSNTAVPNHLSSANDESNTRPADKGSCIICLDKSIDSVLYQCGHMCVCMTCGLNLRRQNNNCPVCRAPIKDIIRAYST